MILNLFSKMARREIHGNVFGVCIDFSINNSTPSITRLGINNDPYNLVNNTSPYSSLPFIGMKEYYHTSNGNFESVPGNYNTGTSNANSAFINGQLVTTSTGRLEILKSKNIYIYIPEFFYQVYDDPVNNKRYYYIATESNEGLFLKHPGSNRYVGKYLMDATKSVSSGKTTTNNIINNSTYTYNTNKWYDYANLCYESTPNNNENGYFCSLDIATYCAVVLLRLIQEVNLSLVYNSNGLYSYVTPYKTGSTDGGSNDSSVSKTGYYTYTYEYQGSNRTEIHYKFNNIEDFFIPNWTPIVGLTEKNGNVYVNTSNLKNFIPTENNINQYFNLVGYSELIANISDVSDRQIKKLQFFPSYKWLFYPDLRQNAGATLGRIKFGVSTSYISELQPTVYHLEYFPTTGVTSMFDIHISKNENAPNVGFPRKIFIPNN